MMQDFTGSSGRSSHHRLSLRQQTSPAHRHATSRPLIFHGNVETGRLAWRDGLPQLQAHGWCDDSPGGIVSLLAAGRAGR